MYTQSRPSANALREFFAIRPRPAAAHDSPTAAAENPSGGPDGPGQGFLKALRSAPCLGKNADSNAGVRINQRFLNDG